MYVLYLDIIDLSVGCQEDDRHERGLSIAAVQQPAPDLPERDLRAVRQDA